MKLSSHAFAIRSHLPRQGGAMSYQSMVPIPRVENIAPEDFKGEFFSKEKPVILTGKMDSWRAMTEWATPEDMKRIFGSAVLHASLNLPTGKAPGHFKWADHHTSMTVAEFVDVLSHSE